MGTKSLDVDDLKIKRDGKRQAIRDGGKLMRDDMMAKGAVDPFEKSQGPRPEVDEDLIGAKIEQLWKFTEEDGTVVPQWCQGMVVAVRKNNRVYIEWDKACHREGDPKITQEQFLKTK